MELSVFAGESDYELVREKLETVGQEWSIRDVTFKFNPCCAIAQTPFIASCELANEKNIDYKEIAEIYYHMNPFESNYPGTKYKGPFTSDTQTTMSCAFNMANAIVNRKCTKKGQQVFDDERILGLVAKTTVVDDESYDIICGKVIIKMNDGTVYEKEMKIDASYYNLTWEENEEVMYRVHEEVGIAKEKTTRLLNIVNNLENADNADDLIAEMRNPQ